MQALLGDVLDLGEAAGQFGGEEPGIPAIAGGDDLGAVRAELAIVERRALLRCAFPEQRRSMIRMVRWVQMASARASNAMRSLWQLGTSVAMS